MGISVFLIGCIAVLGLNICESCILPNDLVTTYNSGFDVVDSSGTLTSGGTFSVSGITYTPGSTAPITVVGMKPTQYDCISNSGDYYLFKSRTTVGDVFAGLANSYVYMCQKLFKSGDQYYYYYMGEEDNISNNFITKGIATLRLTTDSDPDICDVCKVQDDNGRIFPADDDVNVIKDPTTSAGAVIFPENPSVGTDVPPVCATDPVPDPVTDPVPEPGPVCPIELFCTSLLESVEGESYRRKRIVAAKYRSSFKGRGEHLRRSSILMNRRWNNGKGYGRKKQSKEKEWSSQSGSEESVEVNSNIETLIQALIASCQTVVSNV